MSRLGEIVRQLRREPDRPAAAEPGFQQIEGSGGEVIRLRLRRPIFGGMMVVLVLVVGLLLWAAIGRVSGAVVAIGTVRVENNSKVIKHREGGVIRRIFVHEGQRVRRGDVLMRLDPGQAQASVDVWQSAYDSAQADSARFQAEQANAAEIRFPPELLARQSDPQVAALIAGQRALFTSRMMLYRSQATVLRGQADQIAMQIQGSRAQMAATDAQAQLIQEELRGVRELNDLGYAPKSRLLALQRNVASLRGSRGAYLADIGRAQQAIGGLRIQIAQLDEKREGDAGEGLRATQDKLTEAGPKLRATTESRDATIVRAPVDGYVFNLSQFTEGGVAQPGEQLLEIVPVGVPLIISAKVHPNDIAQVRAGMPAEITLTAYNPRTTPPIDGRVSLVPADATTDPQTRETSFAVQIKVDPAAVAKAGPGVHLTPGMSAQVNIITGSRTIMDYLLAPFTEAMRTALRER